MANRKEISVYMSGRSEVWRGKGMLLSDMKLGVIKKFRKRGVEVKNGKDLVWELINLEDPVKMCLIITRVSH